MSFLSFTPFSLEGVGSKQGERTDLSQNLSDHLFDLIFFLQWYHFNASRSKYNILVAKKLSLTTSAGLS